VLVLALLLPVAWLDTGRALSSAIVLNLVAVGFGMLVLAASSGKTFLGPVLRSPWLRWLSTLSYSIYLVHMMLIPLGKHIVIAWLRLGELPVILQVVAMTMVLGTLSLIAAALLHFAVEKPCLRLKDRVYFSPAPRTSKPQLA
jgi:peptidoglycan/LPS O-acetylase OafA/YrhL